MIEYYKEKLMFYRLLLTFAITAASGCVAWFFAQYSTSDPEHLAFNIAAIICLAALITSFTMRIRFYHNKLKEGIK